MDFLDPKKRRAHSIRLVIGYILIAVMIALITLILVFQSYGYDLDRKTGSIIQNGLLYVTTNPEAASIYLNGKQYTTNDNARLVLPTDIYTLKLQREGYRTWQRTFSLTGATINRITYPWLFPSKLVTTPQQTFAAEPQFATVSPDRRLIIVQKPGIPISFEVYDANNPKKAVTSFSVPNEVFTAPGQGQLTLDQWSNDNRHLVVEHNYPGGKEFVVIDRQTPTESFNINKAFGRAPADVELRDNHYDHVYMLGAAGALEYGELKTPTAIKPLLDGVLDFKAYGSDLLLYATATGAPEGKVNVRVRDGDTSYQLRTLVASPSYVLNLAQYNGSWYVAAGAAGDKRVYVYKNPFPIIKGQSKDPLFPITALKVNNPQWLKFSANTQFLAAQDGANFSVYDAEYDRTYTYNTNLQPATPTTTANWMDGHRLTLVSNNQTVVFDYDGTNQQTLTPALPSPNLPVIFNSNYRYLYNFAPSGTQTTLTRTDLLVNP